jgi:RecA-family ATPase
MMSTGDVQVKRKGKDGNGVEVEITKSDKGRMRPTELWREFEARVAYLNPSLVVLDTLADVYGGDENVRTQVRQFVSMLRDLAIRNNCAVLLLGHPSLSGMMSGSGSSGSTGWNNSVRSRLYLHRQLTEDGKPDKDAIKRDPKLRILEVMKANYGAGVGDEIHMRWEAGRFAFVEPRVDIDEHRKRRWVVCGTAGEVQRVESRGRGKSPRRRICAAGVPHNSEGRVFRSLPKRDGTFARYEPNHHRALWAAVEETDPTRRR